MGDIGNILLIIMMVILGGVPSLYIIVSMVVMIGIKIKNKIKYGKSLYD